MPKASCRPSRDLRRIKREIRGRRGCGQVVLPTNAASAQTAHDATAVAPRSRYTREVLLVVAVVCVAGGLVEIIAWITHATSVLVWPNHAPMMVFNAAVAVTMTGLGFVALTRVSRAAAWRMLAVGAGVFDVLLGILALLQHALDRSLGIDELVVDAYVSEPGGHPGRMAMNTAIGVLLAGAGLIVAARARVRGRAITLSAAGSVLIAIAAVALLGQATGRTWAYAWTAHSAMALETAVALAVIAAGLFALAAESAHPRGEWLALPIAAGAFMIGTAVWVGFVEQGKANTVITGSSAVRAGAAVAILMALLVGVAVWLALHAERGRAIAERETQRRRTAEEAMRASQAALLETTAYTRSLLEANPDLILIINDDGRITDLNEATVRATGLPRDQLVGAEFCDLFTEPDTARTAYKQAFAEASIADYPLTIRSPSGAVTNLLLNASVYCDTAGRVRGVVAAARDVSALRVAEEQLALRAAELEDANLELARSNADLEQFAYVASHDLREPLSAISGPLNFVADEYQGKQLDETAQEFIGFAIDGSKRMQTLIDGLLAFSRVGRVEGTVVPTEADRAVEQALDSLTPMLETTNAEVTLDPLPTVVAEPDQLVQVFRNLISNALKFVEPGVVPRVHISARPVGGAWRFEITDNGIGVPDKQRAQLFTMFKRLHPADRYPGTGIGLALVKKIIEWRGGEVGVEPAPGGEGSLFWFTLPAPS
jgi:PAS domain S-box-containing protein